MTFYNVTVFIHKTNRWIFIDYCHVNGVCGNNIGLHTSYGNCQRLCSACNKACIHGKAVAEAVICHTKLSTANRTQRYLRAVGSVKNEHIVLVGQKTACVVNSTANGFVLGIVYRKHRAYVAG